jgi:hypothetical protein
MSPQVWNRDRDDANEDLADACESCVELRQEIAKARQLLGTIRRLEARPAARGHFDDAPELLDALGHAIYAAEIRCRIDAYLGPADSIGRTKRRGRA